MTYNNKPPVNPIAAALVANARAAELRRQKSLANMRTQAAPSPAFVRPQGVAPQPDRGWGIDARTAFGTVGGAMAGAGTALLLGSNPLGWAIAAGGAGMAVPQIYDWFNRPDTEPRASVITKPSGYTPAFPGEGLNRPLSFSGVGSFGPRREILGWKKPNAISQMLGDPIEPILKDEYTGWNPATNLKEYGQRDAWREQYQTELSARNNPGYEATSPGRILRRFGKNYAGDFVRALATVPENIGGVWSRTAAMPTKNPLSKAYRFILGDRTEPDPSKGHGVLMELLRPFEAEQQAVQQIYAGTRGLLGITKQPPLSEKALDYQLAGKVSDAVRTKLVVEYVKNGTWPESVPKPNWYESLGAHLAYNINNAQDSFKNLPLGEQIFAAIATPKLVSGGIQKLRGGAQLIPPINSIAGLSEGFTPTMSLMEDIGQVNAARRLVREGERAGRMLLEQVDHTPTNILEALHTELYLKQTPIRKVLNYAIEKGFSIFDLQRDSKARQMVKVVLPTINEMINVFDGDNIPMLFDNMRNLGDATPLTLAENLSSVQKEAIEFFQNAGMWSRKANTLERSMYGMADGSNISAMNSIGGLTTRKIIGDIAGGDNEKFMKLLSGSRILRDATTEAINMAKESQSELLNELMKRGLSSLGDATPDPYRARAWHKWQQWYASRFTLGPSFGFGLRNLQSEFAKMFILDGNAMKMDLKYMERFGGPTPEFIARNIGFKGGVRTVATRDYQGPINKSKWKIVDAIQNSGFIMAQKGEEAAGLRYYWATIERFMNKWGGRGLLTEGGEHIARLTNANGVRVISQETVDAIDSFARTVHNPEDLNNFIEAIKKGLPRVEYNKELRVLIEQASQDTSVDAEVIRQFRDAINRYLESPNASKNGIKKIVYDLQVSIQASQDAIKQALGNVTTAGPTLVLSPNKKALLIHPSVTIPSNAPSPAVAPAAVAPAAAVVSKIDSMTLEQVSKKIGELVSDMGKVGNSKPSKKVTQTMIGASLDAMQTELDALLVRKGVLDEEGRLAREAFQPAPRPAPAAAEPVVAAKPIPPVAAVEPEVVPPAVVEPAVVARPAIEIPQEDAALINIATNPKSPTAIHDKKVIMSEGYSSGQVDQLAEKATIKYHQQINSGIDPSISAEYSEWRKTFTGTDKQAQDIWDKYYVFSGRRLDLRNHFVQTAEFNAKNIVPGTKTIDITKIKLEIGNYYLVDKAGNVILDGPITLDQFLNTYVPSQLGWKPIEALGTDMTNVPLSFFAGENAPWASEGKGILDGLHQRLTSYQKKSKEIFKATHSYEEAYLQEYYLHGDYLVNNIHEDLGNVNFIINDISPSPSPVYPPAPTETNQFASVVADIKAKNQMMVDLFENSSKMVVGSGNEWYVVDKANPEISGFSYKNKIDAEKEIIAEAQRTQLLVSDWGGGTPEDIDDLLANPEKISAESLARAFNVKPEVGEATLALAQKMNLPLEDILVARGGEAAQDALTQGEKAVIKGRSLEIQNGIQDLLAGKITKQEYNAIVQRYRPVSPVTEIPIPATNAEMLDSVNGVKSNSRGVVGKGLSIRSGEPISLRTDLPWKNKTGKSAVVVHAQDAGNKPGTVIAFEGSGRITNPRFITNEKEAAKIALGEGRTPFASVKGNWSADQSIPADVQSWTQVGFDPTRHSFYYDKATMLPVESGSEAIQIGNTVFVKDAVFGNPESKLFQGAKGSMEIVEGGKALIRGFKNSDTSTAVHELAHVARRFLFDINIPEANRLGITNADINIAEAWSGVTNGVWEAKHDEKFARGFERYMRDGNAPTEGLKRLFAKFEQWLGDIYRVLMGSEIDIEVSPEMRGVFDRLVTRSEFKAAPASDAVSDYMAGQRAAVQKVVDGHSVMPLAGTTPGNESLPLYRFVSGNELNPGSEYGIHWTHSLKEMEQMASEEPGFIIKAKHPGKSNVMDWNNPTDLPIMEREIGGKEYKDKVFPEVPIRPGTKMDIQEITQVGADGKRTNLVPSVSPATVSQGMPGVEPWMMTREEYGKQEWDIYNRQLIDERSALRKGEIDVGPFSKYKSKAAGLKEVEKEIAKITRERNEKGYKNFGDHYGFVSRAIQEGKPVPASVLVDYPDLAAETGAKEMQAWEMTKAEWAEKTRKKLAPSNAEFKSQGFTEEIEPNMDRHYWSVKNAIDNDKPVPAEVLADYPDLVPSVSPAAASVPEIGAVAPSLSGIEAKIEKEIQEEFDKVKKALAEGKPAPSSKYSFTKTQREYINELVQPKIDNWVGPVTFKVPGDGTITLDNPVQATNFLVGVNGKITLPFPKGKKFEAAVAQWEAQRLLGSSDGVLYQSDNTSMVSLTPAEQQALKYSSNNAYMKRISDIISGSEIESLRNPGGAVGGQTAMQLDKYREHIQQRLSELRQVAMRVGTEQRDLMLYDYGQKFNFDRVIESVYGYPFWYLRHYGDYARQMMTDPAYLAKMFQLGLLIEKSNAHKDIPVWMRQHLGIEVPDIYGIKDIFGDKTIYMPILSQIAPLQELLNGNFVNAEREKNVFGQAFNRIYGWGLGPHALIPLIMGTINLAQGYLKNDDEAMNQGAQYFDYLGSQTRLVPAITGYMENKGYGVPGLPSGGLSVDGLAMLAGAAGFLGAPSEKSGFNFILKGLMGVGALAQFYVTHTRTKDGPKFVGTVYDQKRVANVLVEWGQTEGKIVNGIMLTPELLQDAAIVSKNPNTLGLRPEYSNAYQVWSAAVTEARARRLGPALLSYFGGPGMASRGNAEIKSEQMYRRINEIYDMEDNPAVTKEMYSEAWTNLALEFPEMPIYGIFKRFGDDAFDVYAKIALGKVGLGSDRRAVFNSVGLPYDLVSRFYEAKGIKNAFASTTEQSQFKEGIIRMNLLLKAPDMPTKLEWSAASRMYGRLMDELETQYPGTTELQDAFFSLEGESRDQFLLDHLDLKARREMEVALMLNEPEYKKVLAPYYVSIDETQNLIKLMYGQKDPQREAAYKVLLENRKEWSADKEKRFMADFDLFAYDRGYNAMTKSMPDLVAALLEGVEIPLPPTMRADGMGGDYEVKMANNLAGVATKNVERASLNNRVMSGGLGSGSGVAGGGVAGMPGGNTPRDKGSQAAMLADWEENYSKTNVKASGYISEYRDQLSYQLLQPLLEQLGGNTRALVDAFDAPLLQGKWNYLSDSVPLDKSLVDFVRLQGAENLRGALMLNASGGWALENQTWTKVMGTVRSMSDAEVGRLMSQYPELRDLAQVRETLRGYGAPTLNALFDTIGAYVTVGEDGSISIGVENVKKAKPAKGAGKGTKTDRYTADDVGDYVSKWAKTYFGADIEKLYDQYTMIAVVQGDRAARQFWIDHPQLAQYQEFSDQIYKRYRDAKKGQPDNKMNFMDAVAMLKMVKGATRGNSGKSNKHFGVIQAMTKLISLQSQIGGGRGGGGGYSQKPKQDGALYANTVAVIRATNPNLANAFEELMQAAPQRRQVILQANPDLARYITNFSNQQLMEIENSFQSSFQMVTNDSRGMSTGIRVYKQRSGKTGL